MNVYHSRKVAQLVSGDEGAEPLPPLHFYQYSSFHICVAKKSEKSDFFVDIFFRTYYVRKQTCFFLFIIVIIRYQKKGDLKMDIEKELIDKTITNAIVNGYEVVLIFDDDTILNYEASDGGYSCYEIRKKGEANDTL